MVTPAGTSTLVAKTNQTSSGNTASQRQPLKTVQSTPNVSSVKRSLDFKSELGSSSSVLTHKPTLKTDHDGRM